MYFLIKDRLKSKRIKVEYFLTGKIIADFFTKTLQDSLFKNFRDIALVYKYIDEIEDFRLKGETDSSQEHVNKNDLTENFKTLVRDKHESYLEINIQDSIK